MKFNRFNSLMLAIVLAAFVSSCGGSTQSGDSESATDSTEVSTDTTPASFTIDTTGSVVAWKGEVAGVYGHNGVIDVQGGTISTTGGQITGGEVVIDMTSIQPLDTASYTASGKTPQDLVDHLATGDFFLVDEFPTASFKIKSHTGNQLIGDLTIRGKTNEEVVELSSLEIAEDGLKGQGLLVFDRQKYGVNWKHYVQDYILSDDIEIKLDIVASK